jgi:hypothetical protein
MSSKDDDRSLKQKFLYRNIVAAGKYDPEDFAAFLGKKKENGIPL